MPRRPKTGTRRIDTSKRKQVTIDFEPLRALIYMVSARPYFRGSSGMDVFQEYKPIRNKIALLSVEEALSVIWAYCQYLQIDHFQFPKEIEVAPSYRQLEVPQRGISEWELELLAKEVILNGGAVAVKGRTLRTWKLERTC
jgi:hypothetical protein